MTINFIHISKNAGTSVEKLCNIYDNIFKYNNHYVDVFDSTILNQLVILQNPLSRFKSAVRYCLQKYAHEPHVALLIEKQIDTPEAWVKILRDPNHIHYTILMKEMLNKNHFIGAKKLTYKWTYSPQINYINNPKYVLLQENLNDELNILLESLGLTFSLPCINNTKKTVANEYLSDESIAWLETVFYKEDAEIYKYYKDLPLKKRISV